MVMMIALATILYFTRIYTFPQGGSVTLGSMIPLMLLSLRRGAKIGMSAGVIYGLIILYLEPFVYNPFQVLLDYPLAFGALGLTGLFRRLPIIGVAIAMLGRFVCHFLSGIIFFASFAPPEMSPIVYSALYNGSYLGVEFVISAIIIYALLRRGVLNIFR
ncbi:MAG: energy-coupled thiamine transporter ThiT [Thaumarchaeota archaeon RBG_16_49_8]|nr:MAG: energy-coupled thiamine transporter ThiT [Thaumarchaeota archaeon RBG_16_49_8]